MNELSNGKWYTIQNLADWCGFDVETLKKGDSPLKKLSIDFEVETKKGGYHNSQVFYSENILKALKEYQIKNGTSNAYKNKETVISGNVSYIEKDTFTKTINGLLDNPEALLTLVAESSKRIAALQKRTEVAEKALDRLSNSKECYSVNDSAKILKLPYGNKIFYQKLIEMKLLNLDHSPRQDQINAGHFVRDMSFVENLQAYKPTTRITGKGLVFLAKKFNTEIDENYMNSIIEKNKQKALEQKEAI